MSKLQETIYYYQDEKVYKGQKYVLTFPDEWILDESEYSGRNCENCKWYGSWRGVMLGYCFNCAKYVYHYKRGLGFVGCGVEEIYDLEKNTESSAEAGAPATTTYLLDIDLEKIGDIRENPEDTIENHNKQSDKEIDKIYEDLEQEAKDEMRNYFDSMN